MEFNQLDILLAEDSQTQALQLQLLLEKEGESGITVVRDGQEAWERLQQKHFSLVISDLVMPGLDGLELCRRIRDHEFNGYIYVILITALDQKKDIIAGIQAGADDYMTKPVEEEELAARLNTARRILNLEKRLKDKNKEIAELTITDPLTQTYNRRHFNEEFALELKRSARYARPLCLCICDIDHFKRINDQFGHQAGDEVLKAFAQTISSNVRQGIDWLARYGGEEFVIVFPETRLDTAYKATERLRSMIADRPFRTSAGEVSITASFGLLEIPPGRQASETQVLQQADDCLYRAKDQGRNRCLGASL